MPVKQYDQIMIVVTEADRPSSSHEGELCYTEDTDKLWKRTSTSWVEVGGGGSGVAKESHINFTALTSAQTI
jgi:hypothetical protein